MQENVRNEIKNKLRLSDIISKSVSLKKKGESRFIALCPFHNEKTPSFNVLDDKGFYHCFGCGKHGDIFNFVMEKENLNFKEALNYLSQLAGVNISSFSNKLDDSLLKINIEAKNYFIDYLNGNNGEKARQYLVKRKINSKHAQEYSIGFAPPSNHKPTLIDYLIKKGYSRDQIIKSGIGKLNLKTNSLQSYFLNRLVIPIFTLDKRVVGFGGRVIFDGQMPKYLNSAENEIFKKRNILFGANNFKKNKNDFLIICEGYMDVISLRKYGFVAVASLGTSITDIQIEQSLNLSDNIFVVFDGDEAGKNATIRFFEKSLNLLKLGKRIRFTFLNKNLDPEEYIVENGLEAFNDKLKKSLSIADMIWYMGLKLKTDDEPETIAKFWTFVRQKTSLIKNYDIKIAIKDELEKRIKSLRDKNKQSFSETINKNYFSYDFKTKLPDVVVDLRYKAILSLVISFPNLLNKEENKKEIEKIVFKNKELEEIKVEILKILSLMPNITREELIKNLDSKGHRKALNDFKFNDILSRFPIINNEFNVNTCEPLLKDLIFMLNKTKINRN